MSNKKVTAKEIKDTLIGLSAGISLDKVTLIDPDILLYKLLSEFFSDYGDGLTWNYHEDVSISEINPELASQLKTYLLYKGE